MAGGTSQLRGLDIRLREATGVPVVASLMGININTVITFSFAAGSALAAIAGIMLAGEYKTIDPLMGFVPGVKAFVAAVLGGIGSLSGAVLRGLLLGAWSQLERTRDLGGVRLRITLVPEEIVTLVDPEQLEQVLLNLFANACDAMAGAGELEAGVGQHQDE